MTTPLELQNRGSRVTYMASAAVDHFGADAARVADSQRLHSTVNVAATWEEIRAYISRSSSEHRP